MRLLQYKDNYHLGNMLALFFLLSVFCITDLYAENEKRCLATKDAVQAFLQPWLRKADGTCLSNIKKVAIEPIAEEYTFQADTSSVKLGEGESSFSGNVSWQRKDDLLRSDSLRVYRDAAGDITRWKIDEPLTWLGKDIYIQANTAQYAKDAGYEASDLLFLLFGSSNRRIWGWAEQMEAQQLEHAKMQEVFMTSCTPESMDWFIRSPKLVWDANKKLLRLEQPKFYMMNTYMFSLNYYDIYLQKKHRTWTPKFDYINSMFRFGIQYQQQDSRLMIYPYFTNRGSVGMQIADSFFDAVSSAKGDWDGFYKFKDKQFYWRLSHRGKYDLWRGLLSWHLLWKNNASTLNAEDESVRPNQSLANNISWQYAAGDDKAEIGLYWYKRFFQSPKWAIDQNGLPNYDRFPHVHWLHQPQNGLVWGYTYDNISFLSNPAPAVTASRYLMYSGYAANFDLQSNYSNLQAELGSWYRLRYLYNYNDVYAQKRGWFIPRLKAKWSLLYDEGMRIGVDYLYIPRNIKQLEDPIFTQNRWYWSAYASNILRQVDVISDKSDLDFFWYWDNVAGLSNWRLHIAHTLPLAPHKVFLSSDGFEDPQVHYRSKITYWGLQRSDGSMKLEGLWNWQAGKWHALHLHIQRGSMQFYWIEEPGVLLFNNDQDSYFSHARLVGLAYPLYVKGPYRLYTRINYTDNANKNLYYKVGWEYKSCCLQAAVEVSKNQIITGGSLQKYRWPAVAVRLSASGW